MLKSLLSFIVLSASTYSLAADRPNILLMMVDDLGFADFGCYGSEIATPRIDALAEEGLRFTQFYNTAKCHSSRVSLLTGLYCNQAGSQSLSRGVTIAQVLNKAGYFTTMSGKWHLDKQPTDFGFQRYWGHLSGATDFFIGDDTFRLNGEVWNDFDEDFYATDDMVDWSMKFIDEALESGKPFFHYIAFNAPHYPLQAPKEDIEKYLGRYDEGWETLRQERFAKQKRLGIFPNTMELPPLPEHVPAWESLTEQQRELESFRMAIFAAMVDRLDQNIGRMIDYLSAKGELENTIIILCSDNGACPFERSDGLDKAPWEGESFYLYDASWATVGNTPLRHYKQTQHEGGISSPLIISWPGQIKNPGSWERSMGHLIDVMATCLDITGAEYPNSNDIEPLQGKSLLPLIKGEKREGHEELYFQFTSCRALRQGDWKLVSFYQANWELYNIAEDRAEQNDLAKQYPERVEQMTERWFQIARDIDRVPERHLKPVKNTPSPHNKGSWHDPKKTAEWVMPKF
ncbi:MAG: arylsulfatase [Verrucomicrobiota bacterium]